MKKKTLFSASVALTIFSVGISNIAYAEENSEVTKIQVQEDGKSESDSSEVRNTETKNTEDITTKKSEEASSKQVAPKQQDTKTKKAPVEKQTRAVTAGGETATTGSYLIPDVNLRKAVNKELGKKGAELETYSATEAELATLDGILNIEGSFGNLASFTTFKGLEYLKNIKFLQLYYDILPADALTEIGKLTNLKTLTINASYFSGNEATTYELDCAVDGGAPQEQLSIPIQQNVDFSPLASLTNLTSLVLTMNNVQGGGSSYTFAPRMKANLSALGALTNLTYLELGQYGDFDDPTCSWVANLTNLQHFSIIDANLTSVEAVAGLSKLTEFNVNGTYVMDFTPVLDKAYFKGAYDMHFKIGPQFYHTQADGTNILEVNLPTKFDCADPTAIEFSTTALFAGKFGLSAVSATADGLKIDLTVKEPVAHKIYNYISGENDIDKFGFLLGLISTTADGKKIQYSVSPIDVGKMVTFDSNYPDGPKEEVGYGPYDVIEPFEMVREGYRLMGWYTDPETTTPFDFSTSGDLKTNITLYAKWEKLIKVTVQYVDENGKEIHAAQEITGISSEEYDATTADYKLAIDGYTLDESKLPSNASGLFGDTDQVVTYVYKKNEDPVKPADPKDPVVIKRTIIRRKLPQTGEQAQNELIILGVLFVALTGVAAFKLKRAKG